MHLTHALASVVAPWRTLYGNSTVVSTAVTFAHIAALVVGGGLALAADRSTLRALRAGNGERERHLEELHAVHRPVLAALAVAFASGLLLFAADVETFAASPTFWMKLGLVALLLANGAVLARTERALRTTTPAAVPDDSPLWRRLRLTAYTSAGLWLAVVLAGTALVNA